MPNPSATFIDDRFSLAKDFNRCVCRFWPFKIFAAILPVATQDHVEVDNDWTKATSFYHGCRTWEDWFLASLLASTTAENADAMVLSIGTQIASTLPDITDTVEAISFVEGTE